MRDMDIKSILSEDDLKELDDKDQGLIFKSKIKTSKYSLEDIKENILNFFQNEINNISEDNRNKVFNDLNNLSNPTSENLSKWIWNKLKIVLPKLIKIKLSEDHGTGIIYTGE